MLSANLRLPPDGGSLALAQQPPGRIGASLPYMQTHLRSPALGCRKSGLDHLTRDAHRWPQLELILFRFGICRHVRAHKLPEHTHDFARLGMAPLNGLLRVDQIVVHTDLEGAAAGRDKR